MQKRELALLAVAVAAVTAAIAFGATGQKATKADLRLLQRLERVDGTGSGLDADTVRGLTPDQMVAEATNPFATLRTKLYAHARRAVLTPGAETHLYAACDSAADVALSCSGGTIEGATESPITWMGVVLGDGQTTVDQCLVVVHAGASAPQTTIEATVRCVQIP